MKQRLPLPGALSAVGWKLPEGFSESEWLSFGPTLNLVERGNQWWVGDWWTYGEAYGERVRIVTAEDWRGPSHKTCRNAGSISKKFHVSRRRDTLTFKHHAEVAALDDAEADALLDWCLETSPPRSTRELRDEIRRRTNGYPFTAGPDGGCRGFEELHRLVAAGVRFGNIYADPPWLYDNQVTKAATSNHYRGLTVDQLCDSSLMPIGALAAADAHLHLWTTNGFLFECPRIFTAWGFEFKSSFVWIKREIGVGNYWRNAHEFLLTGVRGRAKHFDDHNLRSWHQCSRGRHSGKPDRVRDYIARASPTPRLELFARSEHDGWCSWGDQIQRDLFRAGVAAAVAARDGDKTP